MLAGRFVTMGSPYIVSDRTAMICEPAVGSPTEKKII